MLLALWNYIRGYVIIKISGFGVERFLNLLTFRGIYVWDVCCDKRGIMFKTGRSALEDIDECSKKTGCCCEVLDIRGFPSELKKFEKRKILAAGIIFFVAGLYILSSFIWTVEINGTERIAKEDVEQFCSELGIKAGGLKRLTDPREVTEALIGNFSDISWASVTIEGTCAKIKIVETIPKSEYVDKVSPHDVVAKKGGVITSIAVSGGTPLVKEKDVVEAGDILVSGRVELKAGDEIVGEKYVKASAAINAKVWYNIQDEIALNYDVKQYSGNTKKGYSIDLFGKSILLEPQIKFDSYENNLKNQKTFSIGDYKLPISVNINEYKEYSIERKTRTEDEAKEILEYNIIEKSKELIDNNGEIAHIDIEYTVNNGIVKAKAVVTAIERIDEQKPINTDEGSNADNGTDRDSGGSQQQ